jgi:hypothetical protein
LPALALLLSMLTNGAAEFLAIDIHSSVLANASTPATLVLMLVCLASALHSFTPLAS